MPRPASLSAPLPRRLPLDLLGRGPLLLCLDYDGTLARIAANPKQAWPLERSRAALIAIARYPARLTAAIVSGRDLGELRRLLRIDRGLYLVGVHGLEVLAPSGKLISRGDGTECAAALDRLRQWTGRNIPGGVGLLVEDKRISLALHYRNADLGRVRAVIEDFERFVESDTPSLALKRGKMVVEAAPHAADKGAAVLALLTALEASGTRPAPIYFGDDLTDEDAFRALAGRGVTVKVGEGGPPSAAMYRVGGPDAVAGILIEIAAALERRADGGR